MVEKDEAAARRALVGVEDAARRAIGLTALHERTDRWRSEREAVLHRLRLKADILKLASVEPGQRGGSSREEKGVPYAFLQRLMLRRNNKAGVQSAVRLEKLDASKQAAGCRGRFSNSANPRLAAASPKGFKLLYD